MQAGAARSRPPRIDDPRSRLTRDGPAALSDAEILALVLGDDAGRAAEDVLLRMDGAAGLARAGQAELAAIDGVGARRALRVVAALELGRRAARALAARKPAVGSPEDVVALTAPRLSHLEHETCLALLLDRRNRVLREVVVGTGGISQAPLEPREVFAAALRHPGTCAVIVVHNHPSGDPEPSAEDLAITRRLSSGAELLGLELLDHIIVAARGWASLKQRRAF